MTLICYWLLGLAILLSLIVLYLLWLLRGGVVRPAGEPPGTKEEAPPPVYDPGTIPEGAKVILLVAGSMPETMVLVPGAAAPGFTLMPKQNAPAGFKGVPNDSLFTPEPEMENAWQGLTAKYSSAAFVTDGWKLERLWATGAGQIEAAIDRIAAAHPLGIAVHYLGHGDSDHNVGRDTPFLRFIPRTKATRAYTNADGTKTNVTVFLPDAIQRVGNTYTSTIADKLKTGFPKEIPKTLILDACEQAVALTFRDAAVKFYVTTAVDCPRQDTIFARFSSRFHPLVTPGCFNDYPAHMPGVVSAADTAMAGTKSPCHGIFEVPYYFSGDAFQHPSAEAVRSKPDK